MKANESEPDQIWRDELKEHRGNYYVTYQPADSRWNFAFVDLVFHEVKPEPDEIKRLMEGEMNRWLARFPVPIMVSSFDSTESVIHLPKEEGGAHMMAYSEPSTGKPIHRWGTFLDHEIPAEQTTPEHFGSVYRDIPFQRSKTVREAVDIEQRKLRAGFRIWKTIFILVAVIPLAIELISLGIGWLNNILLTISIPCPLACGRRLFANKRQPIANIWLPLANKRQPFACRRRLFANNRQPFANIWLPLANKRQPLACRRRLFANNRQPFANKSDLVNDKGLCRFRVSVRFVDSFQP
jgi:hypothetical protein